MTGAGDVHVENSRAGRCGARDCVGAELRCKFLPLEVDFYVDDNGKRRTIADPSPDYQSAEPQKYIECAVTKVRPSTDPPTTVSSGTVVGGSRCSASPSRRRPGRPRRQTRTPRPRAARADDRRRGRDGTAGLSGVPERHPAGPVPGGGAGPHRARRTRGAHPRRSRSGGVRGGRALPGSCASSERSSRRPRC